MFFGYRAEAFTDSSCRFNTGSSRHRLPIIIIDIMDRFEWILLMILVISIARNSALLGRIESNTTLATRLSTTARLLSLLQRGKKVWRELVRVDNIRLLFLKCSSIKMTKRKSVIKFRNELLRIWDLMKFEAKIMSDNLLFAWCWLFDNIPYRHVRRAKRYSDGWFVKLSYKRELILVLSTPHSFTIFLFTTSDEL